MKQRMQKIGLLLTESQRSKVTEELRDLGLLHLEHFDPEELPRGEEWQKLQKAREILGEETHSLAARPSFATSKPLVLAKAIIENEDKRVQLEAEQSKVEEDLRLWQLWGEPKREQLQALEKRGLALQLFESTARAYKTFQFEEGLISLPVNESSGRLYFAVFGRSEALHKLPFERQHFPALSREELNKKSLELHEQLKALLHQRENLQAAAPQLEKAQAELMESWRFQRAHDSFQSLSSEAIVFLTAWFPQENKAKVEVKLQNLNLAYAWLPIKREDQVPIAIRNGSYSRLFEPIMRIFQLPRYFEYDLTPLIAVFYPILFAYCLGDAGYGAVLSLVALVGLFSFLRQNKGLALLGLVLGLSTTVMGLIKSGSLFGVPLLANSQSPFIASLAKLVIIPDDSDFFFNAFNVALLIGVLQILVALIIAISKAWRFEGFVSALSHFGKFFIVVSAVALFMEESLGYDALGALLLKALMALGVILVMFFHDMAMPALSRVGSSILPLFFIFTGLLGDVLSYVRLFALGVTSAVLGLVVNRIAMDMLGEWYSWLWVGLFLIFGHCLNLALAGLGSFIHPLRLTFVEFYNNAQFEGGGIEYKPFKKTQTQ